MSASWENGAVGGSVVIKSDAGSNCSFANPWGNAAGGSTPSVHDATTGQLVPFAGVPVSSAAGKVYTFPTERGGSYVITKVT